jgi:type I restriction enzyme S subunit
MTKKSATIPKGYKLTKIGTLPVEWEVKRVKNLNAKVTSGSRGWAEYYDESGSGLFVRITNLDRSNIFLDFTKNKYVNLPDGNTEGKRTRLEEGDILISITADLGIVGYWKTSNHPEAYINQHVSMIRIMDKSVDKPFVAYQIASPLVQRLIQVQCDQGAKAGLNLSSVNNIPIPLPPLPQQQKIAKILATWDQAIQTQSQLINAKKEQKRGLMQRLLTGEVRLPGFEGERRYTSLADVVLKTKGKIVSTNTERTGKPYVGASNFSGNYTFYSHNPEKAVECLSTDVLMLWDGENAGAVSTNHIGFVSSTVARLRPKEGNSGQYLFHYLDFYNGKIRATRTGSGIPHVARDLLKIFTFDLPNQKEQIAIAEVLQAADKELTLLETYLTELREQKRGLMQRLLTGAVRVTVPATA